MSSLTGIINWLDKNKGTRTRIHQDFNKKKKKQVTLTYFQCPTPRSKTLLDGFCDTFADGKTMGKTRRKSTSGNVSAQIRCIRLDTSESPYTILLIQFRRSSHSKGRKKIDSRWNCDYGQSVRETRPARGSETSSRLNSRFVDEATGEKEQTEANLLRLF